MVKNIFISMMVLMAVGCVTVNPNQQKKSKTIEGKAGRTIQPYSISIDADYNSKLDGLIAGYKLLPVSVRNMSLRPFSMDVKEDRWVIVGEKGKKYTAINSLSLKDPVQWRETRDDLRSAIDYPEMIPINYNVNFDLLLPPNADLRYFREIRYYNADMRQEFVIEKEY